MIDSTDGIFDVTVGESVLTGFQQSDSSWILTIIGTGILPKNIPIPIPDNPLIKSPPFVPAKPDSNKP